PSGPLGQSSPPGPFGNGLPSFPVGHCCPLGALGCGSPEGKVGHGKSKGPFGILYTSCRSGQVFGHDFIPGREGNLGLGHGSLGLLGQDILIPIGLLGHSNPPGPFGIGFPSSSTGHC
uniref:Uncharacterized protein n=1 Tax=Parascaris univalens TaxID=6257 RepID=A0A915A443_PARUN